MANTTFSGPIRSEGGFNVINKDGTSEGPNFKDTYKLAERFNIPFVISGGISSIDDVNKLIKDKKIEGIIIGKAIYENKIDLSVLGKI